MSSHPEHAAPFVQHLEQPAATHRGEAVAAAGDHLTLVVDVDVVPARELLLHSLEHQRIGVLDSAECLVREHDAEPERVVGGVALPHGDLVGRLSRARPQLLHQRGEVQPARATADHRDAHGVPPLLMFGRPYFAGRTAEAFRSRYGEAS